jgi:hypothetical protein
MTVDDVQYAIKVLIETPQAGFFWESLTPYQQAALIAACDLWQHRQIITARDVEAKLQMLGVPSQAWETPVRRPLHQLALDELLRESVADRQYLEYTPAFDLLCAWVRRYKTLDQIEGIDYDSQSLHLPG